MRYFERISEENKLTLNKPLNSDMVYYSELNEWFTDNAFRSLSLKFVVDQSIYYKVDHHEYKVDANHYMIACRHSDVKAYFDSEMQVKSICIDLCADSFAEVYSILRSSHTDLDKYVDKYFKYPEFYETINPIGSDPLGKKLAALSELIQKGQEIFLNKEWFLDLIEKIIFKEHSNYLSLTNIYSIKTSTRKEILRRLQLAKEYIDSECLQINEMREIAEQCLMSEYHFYRTFKQAFGFTPFQYVTKRKMDIAFSLVKETDFNLSEIAFSCNYPDASTFSKAFKRHFGFSPADARKNK